MGRPRARGHLPARSRVVAWLAAAGLLTALPAAGQVTSGDAGENAEPMVATLLRTWRPDGVTVVDGLVQVPLGSAAAAGEGGYRFRLTVRDREGRALLSDGWERRVSRPASTLSEAGSTILEPFRFGVKPDEYRVEVRAGPEHEDRPGGGLGASLALTGFSVRPLASDLFLAEKVEPVARDSGAPGPSWALVHDGYRIFTSGRPGITADRPELYYYLELYADPDRAWTASVDARILGEGGGEAYRTTTRRIACSRPVTPFTGRVSLAGLPPGRYRLLMRIRDGADTLLRSADFRMLAGRPSARGGSSPDAEVPSTGGYFASLSDAEMESLFGAAPLLMSQSDWAIYGSLPPEGKRRALTELFRRRDPDPGSAGNPFLDEYLRRIRVIRSRYGERIGTSARPGWKTDRGRIYLKYGEPRDVISEHFPADEGNPYGVIGSHSFGGEPPYEIWSYAKDDGYVYLFVQEDRGGAWRLVYSTDPSERSLPDWTRRVGTGALRDLQEHFGIDPDYGRTGP